MTLQVRHVPFRVRTLHAGRRVARLLVLRARISPHGTNSFLLRDWAAMFVDVIIGCAFVGIRNEHKNFRPHRVSNFVVWNRTHVELHIRLGIRLSGEFVICKRFFPFRIRLLGVWNRPTGFGHVYFGADGFVLQLFHADASSGWKQHVSLGHVQIRRRDVGVGLVPSWLHFVVAKLHTLGESVHHFFAVKKLGQVLDNGLFTFGL